MRVIEEFTVARSNNRPSEDALVATPDFVAVIDGAGDPQRRSWRGRSLGCLAAETLSATVRELTPDTSASAIVAALAQSLDSQRKILADAGLDAPGPAANMVLYSRSLRQIVRVGDCAFRIDDQVFQSQPKAFEQVLIDVRRLVLHAGLGVGTSEETLDDDVAQVFRTLYRYQEPCQNTPVRHPFSFAVLDGSPVPAWGVEIVDVPPGVHEIVLATDGYPELDSTLAQSEEALARLIKGDPLLLGAHAQAKSLGADDSSYDDRTYVRIAVE